MYHCKECKHNNKEDYNEYCLECNQWDIYEDCWILTNFEEQEEKMEE